MRLVTWLATCTLSCVLHDSRCGDVTVFTKPLESAWSQLGCLGRVYNSSVEQEVFNVRCDGIVMRTSLSVTGCPAMARVEIEARGSGADTFLLAAAAAAGAVESPVCY